jgi:hypothetical protein
MGENNQVTDFLGIKPVSDAIGLLTSKSVEGVESFLKIVCVPALQEIGGLTQNQTRVWRLLNAIKIVEKSKGKLVLDEDGNIKISPRLALAIIEEGSKEDKEEIQELWAGLFAASCTEKIDDSNLLYVNILREITYRQALIFKYMCENCKKCLHEGGKVTGSSLHLSLKQLKEITDENDESKLELDFESLGRLDLINLSFDSSFSYTNESVLTPTSLSLNLYIKTQGSKLSIKEYWNGQIEEFKAEDNVFLKSFSDINLNLDNSFDSFLEGIESVK